MVTFPAFNVPSLGPPVQDYGSMLANIGISFENAYDRGRNRSLQDDYADQVKKQWEWTRTHQPGSTPPTGSITPDTSQAGTPAPAFPTARPAAFGAPGNPQWPPTQADIDALAKRAPYIDPDAATAPAVAPTVTPPTPPTTTPSTTTPSSTPKPQASLYGPTMARVANLYGGLGAQPDMGGGQEGVALAGDVTPGTTNLIKKFEGYVPRTIWDVNAHRVGYSSDTKTLPDGSVVPVQAGDTTTRADADRDLARRADEIQNGVISQVGPQAWNGLAQGTKDAVTSVGYNYGRVPAPIVRAIATGNEGIIKAQIASLSANKGRRLQEAALVGTNGYTGSGGSQTTPSSGGGGTSPQVAGGGNTPPIPPPMLPMTTPQGQQGPAIQLAAAPPAPIPPAPSIIPAQQPAVPIPSAAPLPPGHVPATPLAAAPATPVAPAAPVQVASINPNMPLPQIPVRPPEPITPPLIQPGRPAAAAAPPPPVQVAAAGGGATPASGGSPAAVGARPAPPPPLPAPRPVVPAAATVAPAPPGSRPGGSTAPPVPVTAAGGGVGPGAQPSPSVAPPGGAGFRGTAPGSTAFDNPYTGSMLAAMARNPTTAAAAGQWLTSQINAAKNVETVSTNDGVYLVDKNTGQATKIIGKDQKQFRDPTADELAKLKASGYDPKTHGPAYVNMQTGEFTFPAKGTMSITNQAESTREKIAAENEAKLTEQIRENSRNASRQLGTNQLLRQVMDDPNFVSGPTEKTTTLLRRAGTLAGITNSDTLAPNELFNAISGKMVTDALGGKLGAGTSDRDVSLVKTLVPQLSSSQEGNRILVDIMDRQAQRQQDMARLARDYRKDHGGRLDDGFDDVVADFGDKHPLFQPKEYEDMRNRAERATAIQSGQTPRTGAGSPAAPIVATSEADARAKGGKKGMHVIINGQPFMLGD